MVGELGIWENIGGSCCRKISAASRRSSGFGDFVLGL